MKRENPPCTPYKRKAKGKEIRRDVVHGIRLSGARARTCELAAREGRRMTRVQRVAACVLEKALVAFQGTRGPAPSDQAIWGKILWRIGAERFDNAIRDKLKEDVADGEPMFPRRAFQAFLDKHYPKPEKKGDAR